MILEPFLVNLYPRDGAKNTGRSSLITADTEGIPVPIQIPDASSVLIVLSNIFHNCST